MPAMQQEHSRSQTDMFRNRDVQIGALVGLIVGLLLGWFVLGWWIAPVQWVDAQPSDLHPRWQQHYVAMVVDSYLLSGNDDTARARLQGFDNPTLGSLFGEVHAEFEAQGGERQAQGIRQLAQILGVSMVAPSTQAQPETETSGQQAPPAREAEAPATTAQTPTESPRLSRVAQVCGLVLFFLLIVAGSVYGFLQYQRRSIRFEGEGTPVAAQPTERPRSELRIDNMNLGDQVRILYQDDGPRYQQSFQIYRGNGGNETLPIGECGLRGVSTLSRGEQVVACAAWLYQQKFPERAPDTVILVSPQIYENEALRNALTDDPQAGEIIPAEPGQIVRLEHETLEMTLRVTDVEYADPEGQYISRLEIEMEPITKYHESQEPATDFA